MLGGVCAGLGQRLGIDPLILRVGFVAADRRPAALGIVALPDRWALMPGRGRAPPAPRSRACSAGATPGWSRPGMGCSCSRCCCCSATGGSGSATRSSGPLVLAAAGGALIWRQSQRARPSSRRRASAPRPRRRARRGGSTGAASLGAALVVGGGAALPLAQRRARPRPRRVLPVVVVARRASTLILAPWWLRLVRGLADERAERIRSQERAEVAAHLHDSVLQTLALMQKRADDPREVAALARRQERELRAWLNGARPGRATATLAGALEAAAAEVEDDHGVPVEVVTVGDRPLDERAEALVAAAREALVNAVKFAGPEPISRLRRGRGRPRRGLRARPRPGLRPRRRSRPTGAACASRSSGAWSATAAARRSTRAPATGTEVELVMAR